MTETKKTKLTPREVEIMTLIGSGMRGSAIAEKLGMAYFTLRKHRSNILQKFNIHTSAQLSAIAAAMLELNPQNEDDF